jgi:MFS family permease
VNYLGEKKSLVLGFGTYIFYIGAFIPPCEWHEHPDDGLGADYIEMYIALLVCAALTGVGAAIAWVAQGRYLAKISNEQNKGFFTSFFWATYISSLFIGNLLAAYVIVDIPQSEFFMGLCGLVILTSLIFFTLPEPKQEKETQIQEQQNIYNIQTTVDSS